MMKRKKIRSAVVSSLGSYALLKSSAGVVDPYTRASVGTLLGLGLSFSSNPSVRMTGLGIGIGSFLQLMDMQQGGKIISNGYSKISFALHETLGIIELAPYQTPGVAVDGLTIPGSNSVFKISDGVYTKIAGSGFISETPGVGFLVNRFRNAGYKTFNWVRLQKDTRWADLYELSK